METHTAYLYFNMHYFKKKKAQDVLIIVVLTKGNIIYKN